jgi:hypothetical protein
MTGSRLTAAFSIAFAMWLATLRYSFDAGGTESALAALQAVLTVVILVSALSILFLLLMDGWRARQIPVAVIFFAGAVVAAELLWRLRLIQGLSGNGFKLVSLVVLIGQPLIATLGIATATVLWRGSAAKAD